MQQNRRIPLLMLTPLFSAYIHVPVGYAAFAHELTVEPLELARVGFNVTDVRHFADGGHFAAFELPKELAGHVFHFVKTLV